MFTPTVNLMERGVEEKFGVVRGPSYFGGCLGMCCNTQFEVTKNDQNLGTIRKLKDGKGLEFRYVQSFGKPILTCYSLFDVLTF
jgi:hypothetical protein